MNNKNCVTRELRLTPKRAERIKHIEDGAKELGIPITLNLNTETMAGLGALWIQVQLWLEDKHDKDKVEVSHE
jgi:hypothetical protein